MQLDALVLYAPDGRTQTIRFRPGTLNIITGDSLKGKSSLLNILRFCLGDDSPHAPHGPIQDSVAWYGLLAHAGDASFFIGRPAPAALAKTTSEAMLLVGVDAAPSFETLAANTTNRALRQHLGGLIGIRENIAASSPGSLNQGLAATFVHALYFCFQAQGEIANPGLLFHHQNREFQAQAIRDTLPYFLGVQGLEDLRRRGERQALIRQLRQRQRALLGAQAERDTGLDRALALVSEAQDTGFLGVESRVATVQEARNILQALINSAPHPTGDAPIGLVGEELRRERRAVREQLREIAYQLQSLDDFAVANDGYQYELREQQARLASINLIPSAEADDARCAMCNQPLALDNGTYERAQRAIRSTQRRLAGASRDVPRVEAARTNLLETQQRLQLRMAEINQALGAIADRDDLVAKAQETINVQSYVRGRISQYLDSSSLPSDAEFIAIEQEIESLQARIEELDSLLDRAEVRSRTVSLLNTIGRRMSEWARQLGLEHSDTGARIDLDRLTIVADTSTGPAYMDRGEIGSAMNWVGYHLCAYLALQQFFISHQRPVPSFIVLDQPSQAFFPRERTTGGDLEELSDTDRENTRRLYRLMYNVVVELGGRLQVIALDHAEFPSEPWFMDAIIERWRGDAALIPNSWLDGS